MEEYIKLSELQKFCKKYTESDAVSLILAGRTDLLHTTDVIGCSEYEKLCLVNLDLAETNKGLLAEHKELVELRSKIDRAIEEMTRLLNSTNNIDLENRTYDCIEIFKRNIGA